VWKNLTRLFHWNCFQAGTGRSYVVLATLYILKVQGAESKEEKTNRKEKGIERIHISPP